MAKITYEDKEALNINSSVADKNKVNASDLNEIKNAVNSNDDTLNDALTQIKEDTISILNLKIKNNVLFVKPTSNQTTSKQYVEQSNFTVLEQIGDGIVISNNKIKIQGNISYVKISATIGGSTAKDQLVYLYLRKNSNNINGSWSVSTIKASVYFKMISQAIVPVKIGDILSYAVYGDGATIEEAKSSLIIEAIS